MRRFLCILAVFLLCGVANASSIDEIEIATKGQTTLGLGVGIPPFTSGAAADIPCFSLSASAGMASGFIRSDLFGKNGAVDLGVQFSACHYRDEFGLYYTTQKVKVFQGSLTLRSAFHFQFMKFFDTYAGICGGVDICAESFMERTEYTEQSHFELWNEIESNTFSPILGVYVGSKWFFTNNFALGVEAAYDFLRTDDEACLEAYGRSHYGGSALPIISLIASFKLGKN
ncbi:MAG: hypothetical protein IKX43_04900 [Paludibacteraceae bacterium]|nr:hypothetical protein [Paludibacteraceae bacterium]